jgi:hypothetical protein
MMEMVWTAPVRMDVNVTPGRFLALMLAELIVVLSGMETTEEPGTKPPARSP